MQGIRGWEEERGGRGDRASPEKTEEELKIERMQGIREWEEGGGGRGRGTAISIKRGTGIIELIPLYSYDPPQLSQNFVR